MGELFDTFDTFDPKSIKMPSAAKLGIIKRSGFGPRLRLIPAGWTNGYILDLVMRPKVVKVVVDALSYEPLSVDAQIVKRLVDRATVAAKIPVKPLAIESNAGQGITAVVLGNIWAEMAVKANKEYFAYFARTHRGCNFFAPNDGSALEVRVSGRLVGLLMPLRADISPRELYWKVMGII